MSWLSRKEEPIPSRRSVSKGSLPPLGGQAHEGGSRDACRFMKRAGLVLDCSGNSPPGDPLLRGLSAKTSSG